MFGLRRRKCSSGCRARISSAVGGRSMQHCYSRRERALELAGVRFFCGIFSAFTWNGRFRVESRATRLPPKRPVLSHALDCCRQFAACRPQAGKIPRIGLKCLNAVPDRSATRNWPGSVSPSHRTKSARLAAVMWPWTTSASIARCFPSRLFMAHCADFEAAPAHAS